MDSTAMAARRWPQSAPPRPDSRRAASRRSGTSLTLSGGVPLPSAHVGRAANLPFAFRSLQMNGNSGYRSALYANGLGRWPARRAATQERLQVCSGWMNQPMQCARVTEDCVHGRGRRGPLTRDKAEARVTHYAARLIPAAGCPLWSAGSVARTSRPPHM